MDSHDPTTTAAEMAVPVPEIMDSSSNRCSAGISIKEYNLK
jgi:hypothetical protein